MKRKSFLLPVAALALLVSFGLAACGGGNGGAGGDSKTQQNSGKQEKITITAAEGKTKLILGESVQLTASVDGVTWSSTDETIATVSATGLVESKAVGKVQIKANKDGYKEGSISINIDLEKIEVTATGSKTTLLATETVQLVSSQEGVAWESDAPEVATVSATGLVTALKFGTAKITAKKQGFNDGSITINVVRPEASLIIDLTTGAEHYSADGWWAITSSSYGFNMESGGGATPVTKAQSYGQETESDSYIGAFGVGDKETVKFNASKAGKAEFVVNIGNSDEVALGEVMSIKLNGQAVDLSQVTLPAHEGQSGNSLEFSDLSLGELDLVANENTLVFEMLADNTVYLNEISVYAGDATVTLVNPPEKKQIAIDPASYQVIVDETVQIVTTETGVAFSSLDETIATVDASGVVTGVKVGKTNILLRKEGMYSVRAEVIVNPKPVAGQIIIEAEDGAEVTSDWGSGAYMKQTDGGAMGGSAVHSGGAYVTYFSMGGGDVDLTLTLSFEATEAKVMVLSVVGSAPMSFGGEAAPYVFADSAEITLNETPVTLGDQSFPAPEGYSSEMVEVVLGDVSVAKGANTLVFHTTGAAPSIDCFKLSVK